ncbi:hypothetical protein SAMN04489761_4647 [Tenacibaculum sp. MAR_2009_124]|uniref:hypothetical protein n=1 Tax=Tenacibaculum sp. MAR_2009_124 TaxID=1250059 RepID=UPI0008946C22|nr:hypothetical protein [Tenacibaculum sp. MAR_2009_124]SED21441.1 hypothetical protein SAMN04489761_4647 [Tenacibaculum sp. MAR_2009_124]
MTNNPISIKCTCGAGHKITCPNCSEVKMVILLKNGFSHLKIKMSNNKKANPVWYNHLSKNRKNANTIINGMFRRFQNSEYSDKANVLRFYSNTSGELITSVKL